MIYIMNQVPFLPTGSGEGWRHLATPSRIRGSVDDW